MRAHLVAWGCLALMTIGCGAPQPAADPAADDSTADVAGQMTVVGSYDSKNPSGGQLKALKLGMDGRFSADYQKRCAIDPQLPCVLVHEEGPYYATVQPPSLKIHAEVHQAVDADSMQPVDDAAPMSDPLWSYRFLTSRVIGDPESVLSDTPFNYPSALELTPIDSQGAATGDKLTLTKSDPPSACSAQQTKVCRGYSSRCVVLPAPPRLVGLGATYMASCVN
jgi:hypothetical protein